MQSPVIRSLAWGLCVLPIGLTTSVSAQATPQAPNQTAVPSAPAKPRARPADAGESIPTRADFVRGAYGPFRANNDLLYYHLDIRVDADHYFVDVNKQ